eukprot:Platyproteum_vivax@DN5803_c0_g1_i3.p1
MLLMTRMMLKTCRDRYKMDPSRLFICNAELKKLRSTRRMILRRFPKHDMKEMPRTTLELTCREMPLPEFFHRLYILKKVPRSISMDMRLALYNEKAGTAQEREWLPYLTSKSRYNHRRQLKWEDANRNFDYYEVRREWIDKYSNNLQRRVNEARIARGLPAFT